MANKKYDYHLIDESGSSLVESQEFLLPIKGTFRHEYGLYAVAFYSDDHGNYTQVYDHITQVICDRVMSNKEIKEAAESNLKQP